MINLSNINNLKMITNSHNNKDLVFILILQGNIYVQVQEYKVLVLVLIAEGKILILVLVSKGKDLVLVLVSKDKVLVLILPRKIVEVLVSVLILVSVLVLKQCLNYITM